MENKFTDWKAERHESTPRGWLVICRRLVPEKRRSDMKIHRASTGAPIWYTEAGAVKKAKELNKKEEGK